MNDKDKNRVLELADKFKLTTDQTVDFLLKRKYLTYEGDSKNLIPTPLGYYYGHFDKTGVTTTGQILETTENNNVIIGYTSGNLIRLYENIKTGELNVSVEDLAKANGFNTTEEYLVSDIGLDMLNENKSKGGYWPLKEFDI